jgi:SH3-like domain-containing protein
MSVRKLLILLLLTFIFPINIFAKENNYYLILKNNEVNVRYGPGFDYPIKYVYKKKNLPIKVIDKKENFRRIIDFKKNSGWIHVSQLKKGKFLILLKDQILFSKPTKYSKPILKILKGRLLLVKKCKKKWCKVKTEDYLGWIVINNIWGTY